MDPPFRGPIETRLVVRVEWRAISEMGKILLIGSLSPSVTKYQTWVAKSDLFFAYPRANAKSVI